MAVIGVGKECVREQRPGLLLFKMIEPGGIGPGQLVVDLPQPGATGGIIAAIKVRRSVIAGRRCYPWLEGFIAVFEFHMEGMVAADLELIGKLADEKVGRQSNVGSAGRAQYVDLRMIEIGIV